MVSCIKKASEIFKCDEYNKIFKSNLIVYSKKNSFILKINLIRTDYCVGKLNCNLMMLFEYRRNFLIR